MKIFSGKTACMAILVSLMGFSFLFSSCDVGSGSSSGSSTAVKGPLPDKTVSGSVLNVSMTAAVDTLDPQKALYSNSFELIGCLMDGLMQVGSDGSVQKAICETETVSDDKLVYTFTLRKDAYWSNGDPVTADDFVYGWQRALDPEVGSEYYYMISDIAQIKNGVAIAAGNMDPSQLGVRAIDDHTLRVELATPVPFFDQLLYFCTFYPANKKFIESVGENYATSPDTYLCNGAFILTDYSEDGDTVTLVKNTAYYDASRVKLAGIKYYIPENYKQSLQMYKDGQLDLIELAGYQVAGCESSPEFRLVDSGFMFFLTFNMDAEACSNVHVRRAINLAIDRNKITDILSDGSKVSYTPVPAGYAYGEDGKDFTAAGAEFPDYCDYNPELARKEIREAMAETGKKHFTVKLLTYESGTTADVMSEIKRSVEEAVPELTIELDILTDKDTREAIADGEFEMGENNWGPDYADPMTYLAMWSSDNEQNSGHYHNPQYDAYIASCLDGELAVKTQERWKTLKSAEKLLIEDAAIVPLYTQCNADMIKSNVKNVEFHAVAINRIYKNTTK